MTLTCGEHVLGQMPQTHVGGQFPAQSCYVVQTYPQLPLSSHKGNTSV